MKPIKRLLVLLLALCLCFGCVMPALAQDEAVTTDESETSEEEFYEGYELFEYLYNYLLENHIDKPEGEDVLLKVIKKMIEDDPELLDKFIKALMKSEDPYSYYFSKEEYAEYKATYDYNGIGVSVHYNKGYTKVTAVNDGSSAMVEGVLPGDIFYKVNGKTVAGLAQEDMMNLLRGEKGTKVNVDFYRPSEKKVYSFELTRKSLKKTPVQWSFYTADNGEKYALCDIDTFFNYSTYFYFTLFLSDLINNNVGNVIIDLRDNPGGNMNATFDTLNWLIPGVNKAICTVLYADGTNTTYRTTGRGIELNKLAIVVNENTASAAELVAKSTQEYGIAKIIGKQTYGKAVGQYQKMQADGSVISLTSLEILTPKGKKYNGIGVIPDIVAENAYVQYPQAVKYEYLNTQNYSQAKMYTTNSVNYALEQRLVLLGYLDTADMVFDKDTVKALWDFQTNVSLPATGTFNLETLNAMTDLVNLVKIIGINVDPMMEQAVEYVTK